MKLPRDPELGWATRKVAWSRNVFDTPEEFMAHHTHGRGDPKELAERAL